MQEDQEEAGAEMRSRALVGILFCLVLGALGAGVPAASAYREPLVHPETQQPEAWLFAEELSRLPFSTEGQIEGACGLAVSPSGSLLISDYYHRFIHTFSTSGLYGGSQSLAGGDPRAEINKLNSVCGLAVDGAGTIYANELHQRVLRLPGEEVIDPGPSTGVAVDGAGNVYVDDRTYVAVYDAPVIPGEAAAEKIGVGSLGDGFGIAVDTKMGRIYVPDASDETVKVFERGVGPSVDTIAGPSGKLSFNSLFNASVAVDNSSGEGEGHLLVVDDLKPLFQFPEAAVYEFDSDGSYLDRLQVRSVGPVGEEREGPIFGEPSGIAVDPSNGDLFVTTGNSEQSNVVAYGPYEATAPAPAAASPPGGEGSSASGAALAARDHAPAPLPSGVDRKGGSEAVIIRHGPVQVSFNGKLTPQRLPRHGSAPVGIAIDARISATGNGSPPQLRRISIAINRNGHFLSKGLPACRVDQIQPSTTSGALAACGPSLVGEGHFSADVKLPEQSPFPSEGKVLAFNGRVNGKPAILAHIYGTQPAPTSAVLPFVLGSGRGTYGTTLEASLPQATGSWGYVTGLRMSLRRSFSYHGKAQSYLSAGCPAPPGFPSAAFPLARTGFVFAGGPTLVSVLNRTCTAKG
jgi:DNA-binding beta-propeller fold protein YncE